MYPEIMMQITSFWPLFFFAVGVQGAFLSLNLFFRRKANRSNFYLAILLALFAISIIDVIAFWTMYSCEDPFWLGISTLFIFLYGPLFYFFLRGSGKDSISDKSKHFLIAFIVLLWHVYFLAITRVTGVVIISASHFQFINTILLPAFGLISLVVYAHLAFRYVVNLEKRHGIKIMRSWHWLGLIFKAYLLFVLFHVIFFVNIMLGDSSQTPDIFMVLGYALIIYSTGYLALKTSTLLNGIRVDNTKYQAMLLSKNISESLYEKLKQHMVTHKPYKKNEIKLAELASELSLTPHQLSQVINQNARQNFAEFINTFRVNEAIQLITQIDRINQLAYEVGFNNRTTFNQVFKSTTGYTPTEYRKQFGRNQVTEK